MRCFDIQLQRKLSHFTELFPYILFLSPVSTLEDDAKQTLQRERERDPPSAVCKERMKWQTCQAMQRRLPNVFHTLPGASAENRAGRTMRKGGRKQNKNTCVEPLWSFMLIQFDFLLAILLAKGGADASDGSRTEKRLHVHINQSTVTVSATKPTLSLILV